MIQLTKGLIHEGRSLNGGWGREQVEALGLTWPLDKKWISGMIGVRVTEEQYSRFLALKDRHLKPGTLEKLATRLLKSTNGKFRKPSTQRVAKKKDDPIMDYARDVVSRMSSGGQGSNYSELD